MKHVQRLAYMSMVAMLLPACGRANKGAPVIPQLNGHVPFTGINESQVRPNTYKVLFHFKGKDGAYPFSGLIDVGGVFYGTTDGAAPIIVARSLALQKVERKKYCTASRRAAMAAGRSPTCWT